ncbi:hypothetical protein LK07_06690 [Streptomyces pluripotens]|uniref:Uncharacterized protein n=1 Tax=Streptomyces pluripotens TaxID=1355015 RepID=A0A221NUT8_9ACTN|nr:hypothetical protein LK06_005590 [Streptomyces pluripotens]ASN23763.1 hypothetical protein LK07_06690 [Streptomyces pluripotens]
MYVPPRRSLAWGRADGVGTPRRTAGEERCLRPAQSHAGDSPAYASSSHGHVADLSHTRRNPCGVHHVSFS